MKAVIFDMDGVLVNTEPLHFRCWKKVFGDEGIDLDYDIYKPCIGSTMTFLLQLIRDNYGKTFDRMAAEKDRLIREEGYPKLPSLVETVRKFHEEGYVLAVASSSPMRHIDQALGELGLSDCFAVKVSGENVAHPKPAPDTFLIAAEKLGVLPKDCLVVEDSTNGGKAAAAAGMDCVWFHNPDSGEQYSPQAVLELTSWERDAAGKVLELLRK